MLRSSAVWCTTALHNSSSGSRGPFLDGLLQLVKLHLAHRNAAADRHTDACHAIETEFLRELESFRPCFTLAASLELSPQYARRLHAALRYFALGDDPLMRQLELMLGKQQLRQTRTPPPSLSSPLSTAGAAAVTPAGRFKGVVPHARSDATSVPAHACRFLDESAETTLPSELPNAPRVDVNAPRRPGALRMPAAHRGHWVLQDPDIAITRQERREDPW